MKLVTFKQLLLRKLTWYSAIRVKKIAKNLVNAELVHVSVLAMSKQEHMIQAILKAIRSKDIAKAMCKAASNQLSVHPCDVEKILCCTKPERKKLFEQGYLEVAFSDSFKYGWVEYATLDSVVVVIDKFDKIRERFEKEKTKNRKLGAKKAARNRKIKKLLERKQVIIPEILSV